MSIFKHAVIALLFAGNSSGGSITPFPLSQVRLGEGVFKDSMEVNRRVLDGIGADRALYCFRFQAGLPTHGAKPLESWAAPEPHGAFPGFFEGHYLSAISLMHAQTGDQALRTQVDYMVAGLAKCQEALGGGYLFASPPEEFAPDRLDGVPWYRMHKLMEGLMAAHRHAGNGQALEVLNKLAEWIDGQMKRYGDELEKVKKVEYGGMTEALVNLYEATRNPRHREMAHAWEQRGQVLDTFHQHEDFCEHANTLLAKMVGAARIAEVEGDEYHRTATRNFWDLVAGTGRKTYATGGTSVHEGMPGVRAVAGTQSRMAQETCVSYNLQKVTHSLFHLTGDPKYMDYYERQLFNAILGSQDPVSGWKTYYQPLNANSVKDFRSNQTGCYCCNGTGMENPSKYGGAIYSHNDVDLRVNLFIASTVDWPEKGLQIEQVTRFPEEAKSTLVVRAKQPVVMDIGIRVPGWCQQGFAIAVNGVVQKIEAVPSSYATISRTWESGDRIEVRLPMAFSAYPMPDRPSQLAFMFGPLVMVGEGARPWLGELVGDPGNPGNWTNRLDAWFAPVPGAPLHFTARDDAGRTIRFKPYHQVGGGEFFTGYWDVVKEPTIVDDHNLALGKRTLCAQISPPGVNVECFMRAEKAVDGQHGGDDDWYVKWLPNGMAPQWITVDLGAKHEVGAIEWFATREDIEAKVPYRYTIEHSNDNETWHRYAGDQDNTRVKASYRHERAVTARFLKLTILPQAGLEGNAARPKVAEFKVFGPQGG